MVYALSHTRLSRALRQLGRRHVAEWNLWGLKPCLHTVPRSALGAMQFAPFSKGPDKKRSPKISSIFKLLTLRPEKMTIADQQTIDLSGKLMPFVPTTTESFLQCVYDREYDIISQNYKYTPFPGNTRGVFYYHNAQDMPELYARVRFRICDSPAEFERGRDLLDPRGDVWGYSLLELVKLKLMEGFFSLLRTENLIDEDLINDIHKLDITLNLRRYQYSLSDPFYLNVAQAKNVVIYVTRTKVTRLCFPAHAFMSRKGPFRAMPLTGSIKVQFELSDLPEHKKLGPTLVIRVLDIVKPIVVNPTYDENLVPFPVPGTLLHHFKRGKKSVLRIPLKRQRMADDLLELMKASWP